MTQRYSRRELLGGIGIIAAATVGLSVATTALGRSSVVESDGRLTVTATTGQVGDAARNVGGDRVTVNALMGAGIDPHSYTPSEGDLQRLFDARVVLHSGHHLEGRFDDVFAALAAEKPIAGTAEAIPEELLISSDAFATQVDPHLWADPIIWDYTITATADALAAADPDGAAIYRQNADAYRATVAEFATRARTALETVPPERRVLVTAHDAFSYFGRQFGYEVVGIQGVSTETEAGVNDLQRIAGLIADRQIPSMFVETSVSPATINAVQAAVRDQGFEVVIGGQLYSDALGDEGTLEGTYLGMFRHNVQTIVTSLGGDASAVETI